MRFLHALLVLMVMTLTGGTHPFLCALEQTAHYRMVRLDGSDGLPSSSVSGIVQDAYGFLWFGTQGGLSRYDGYEFTHYTKEPFNSESLPHDLVQTIYSDDGYSIWAGTYNGMAKIDLKSGRLKRYLPASGDEEGLNGAVVTSITRDAGGLLWAGTLNGLNRLDDEEAGTFTSYLDGITVRSVFLSSAGTLWVGTYDGLYRYDPLKDGFDHYPSEPGREGALQSPYVMALAEDRDGIIWLGTWGSGGLSSLDPASGLFISYRLPAQESYVVNCGEEGRVWVGSWGGGLIAFHPGDGSVRRYRHEDGEAGGLGTDIVYSLFHDRAGVFWVGTNGGGVTRMIPIESEFPFWGHNDDDPDALPPGKITDIYEDRSGTLWVAVYNGGLYRYLPGEERWQGYRHDPDNFSTISNDIVNEMYESSDGTFWVCTNGGLNTMDRGTGAFTLFLPDLDGLGEPGEDIVYDFLEAGPGEYWIATYRGGIVHWDSVSGDMRFYRHDNEDPASLSDNMVYTLLLDEEGTLWAGTNRGLNRYRPESDDFVSYTYREGDRGSISADTIRTLLVDGRNRMWVGTVGGGLNLMDRDTERFRFWSRRDGFPDNTIVSLLEDGKGTLWVGTARGLGTFDTDRMSFKLLDATDGVVGEEFNVGAFRNDRGELYFGSLSGVIKILPSTFRDNEHIPPVRLTSFRIFDQEYDSEKTLAGVEAVELSHRQNFISFEFAALDYTDPAKNEYMYRLVGFDRDWIYSGNRRYASYTNLPGGEYTFQVRGSNNDGVWNEEGRNLVIKVIPPVWKRPAAYVLYLFIAAAAVAFSVFLLFRRERRLLAVEELRLERERMRLEKDAAEQAARTKSSIIAKLSHEFRTPLNAIIGYSGLIARKTDNAELIEYAGLIGGSGRQLNEFVSGILDLSKSEAGKEILVPSVVDVRRLAGDALRIVEPAAGEKGLDLFSSIDPAVPAYAGFDAGKFRQVLYNLMGNAVKFTFEGSVTLSVWIDAEMLVWSVADTGIGIPEDQRERIFEAFEQQADQDQLFGGTGLGLTISRNSVRAMGGTLTVDEREGGGSVFTVSIPFERVQREEAERAAAALSEACADGPPEKAHGSGAPFDGLREELKGVADSTRQLVIEAAEDLFGGDFFSQAPCAEGYWVLERWEALGSRLSRIGTFFRSPAVGKLGKLLESAAERARISELESLSTLLLSLKTGGREEAP